MIKKYYILVLTFLCLFLGQVSYAITIDEGSGGDDEYGDWIQDQLSNLFGHEILNYEIDENGKITYVEYYEPENVGQWGYDGRTGEYGLYESTYWYEFEDGYDVWGYDEYGFDEDGFDENGYDENGYDENGYDINGFDSYGNSMFDDITNPDDDLGDLGPQPPTLLIWNLDNDGDGWHSQVIQAETSPGANWKETTSGIDCNDARYSLINDCSTADPCAEIKNILNYEAPDPNTKDLKPNINRLEDVVEAAVNDKEEGFEISKRMNSDETYRYEFDIAQTGLKFEIEMQTAGSIIGTFHSHPSDGVAMFSFQDLRHLTNLYNNSKTQHIQDVFCGLVAKDEQGNTNVYILKVDDIAKLQKLVDDTWGSKKYAKYTTDKKRRDAIHEDQKWKYGQESDKELSFLKQFPAAGISVYKADATLSNFSKLTLTNGQVAKTPCN